MAFLTSVAGYVLTSVLSGIGGWLLKVLHIWFTDRQQKQVDEAATQKAVDADKAAQTPAERESAAKGIADNV